MNRFCLLCILLLFSAPLLRAQQSREVQLHFRTAVDFGAGWWVHDLGSTQPGDPNTEGWERTHNSPVWGPTGTFIVQIERWQLGLQGSYLQLVDDDFIGTEHRTYYYDKFNISGGSVRILRAGGTLGYHVIDRPRFALTPTLGAGWFTMQTLHPEENNFGKRMYWRLGIAATVDLNRWLSLVILPRYDAMTIWPKERNGKEKHQIISFGALLALQFQLY